MRKAIYTVIGATMIAAMTSCTIESSDNGKLDGFWHMEQLDTLATGGTQDLSDSLMFWCIDTKLIGVRGSGRSHNLGYYLRFTQTSDSVTVHSPHRNGWHQDRVDGGDTPLDDAKEIAPYGINNLREPFYKDRLTGSRMVLRSKTLRLHFRKF